MEFSLKILQQASIQKMLSYQLENIDSVLLNDGFREIEEIALMNDVEKDESVSPIVITDHAYQRAKERLSMNHGSFKKLSEKAFTDGCKHSDSAGNLKKFIDKIYLRNQTANNVRIYGENIFLFHNNRLVTVYQVPTNLKKSTKKIQEIKKAGG